jgi:hypothetical protein
MTLLRICFSLCLCVVVTGCSRGGAPSNDSLASPVASSALHDTANYKVTIEPVGPYAKDQPGAVRVRLFAKGDYKINDEYPFKFVCQDPPAKGVSYPKPSLGKGDGKFEGKEAELSVPFVPSESGTVQVGGVFSLSVCTASNCLIDKRPLLVDVSVP